MGPTARRVILAALLLSALTGPSAAQSSPPGAVGGCAGIQDNAARLSCFDDASGRRPSGTRTGDNTALPPDAAAPADAGEGSLLDSRWELEKRSKRGAFRMRAYKPVFLAPVSWTSDVNSMPHTPNPQTSVSEPQDIDDVEAKFQISLKAKLVENLLGDKVDLWGAYTQVSRWQIYNSENSRPFRETNYEPEVMLVGRTDYGILGWRGRLAGVGLNHQSNGRSLPLSRSWNRVMFLLGLDREGWALTIRPWLRIKEDAEDDDNPDISDYMGRFDATLVRVWKKYQIALTGRHSLHGGVRSHGGLQLEWSFPIQGELRGRVQLFHGYGESLVDYNQKATWVSLGLSLVEWY